MIKFVLATWCKMNGVDENWTIACRLTFELILSSRQFRNRPRLPASEEGTVRRKTRESERVNGCSEGGMRTSQGSQMNERGERVKKIGEDVKCGCRAEVREKDISWLPTA